MIFVLGFMLAGSVVVAKADTLRFAWGYSDAAQAIIDGFRLYEDNQPLSIVIPPSARTVDTPYIEDRQARRYHLTAFAGSEESVPSTPVDIPAFWDGIPAILGGTLSVQILDENGNVLQEINTSVQGTINQ